MIAVGKTDSDGKPTSKVRAVHDQSEAVITPGSKIWSKENSLKGGSSKFWFPRVVLLTLVDIVTRLVAMALAYPGVALKDMDAAFRRVRVVSRDVALMATRVGAPESSEQWGLRRCKSIIGTMRCRVNGGTVILACTQLPSSTTRAFSATKLGSGNGSPRRRASSQVC